jgi:hypothetical protein
MSLFIYLALPTRAGSPQQHMPITVGPFCLTHPVNFPCGRKPEYPEETHDFRQSVDFYSFHMRTGFESHWESFHWDLNLRPQRWKASALTTWPPKPQLTSIKLDHTFNKSAHNEFHNFWKISCILRQTDGLLLFCLYMELTQPILAIFF